MMAPTPAEAMRRLSEADRACAIAANPNVIGAARFTQTRRQAELADAYRRPVGGGVA